MALTGESVGEICGKPNVLDVLEPDPALSEAYAPRCAAYKSLYRSLTPHFRFR